MELDANAVKTKQTVPVVNTKKEYIPTKQVEILFNVFLILSFIFNWSIT